jgi:uncharacterized phage protein (TIGR02218 family)
VSGLADHLASGATTVCRCWAVVRKDGTTLGFTDHDLPVSFDGMDFRAEAGMTAQAIETSLGLSVDNGEAIGALSDAAIREVDILAGRYDGAEVTAWHVNWRVPAERQIVFRGTIGEIRRGGGAFHAELRGLSEKLNQPRGRAYQASCSAVLGDVECGFDLQTPGFSAEAKIQSVEGAAIVVDDPGYLEKGWFTQGVLTVLDGAAAGLSGMIKADEEGSDAQRRVVLWQELGAGPSVGDRIRLIAGCDKRFETCRLKFSNHMNYRGFPDIPGDDWLMASPATTGERDGGSRR